jgi:hypothetical protein
MQKIVDFVLHFIVELFVFLTILLTSVGLIVRIFGL